MVTIDVPYVHVPDHFTWTLSGFNADGTPDTTAVFCRTPSVGTTVSTWTNNPALGGWVRTPYESMGARIEASAAPQPTPPSQVVFLDFSAEPTTGPLAPAKPSFGADDMGYDVARTGEFITDSVRYVREYLAPYRVSVVTDRPASGQYSTVHIGGILPDWLKAINSPPAFAQVNVPYLVDYANVNKVDQAWVYSKSIPTAGYIDGDAGDKRYLANVIAHEVGHILGLWHAKSTTEDLIMWTTGGHHQTFGSGQIVLTYAPEVVLPLVEDGNGYLAWALGTSQYEPGALPKPGEYDLFFTLWGNWVYKLALDALTLPVHNLKATVVYPELGMILPEMDLGDCATGGSFQFDLPAFEGAHGYVLLTGVSESGGTQDIFCVPEGAVYDPTSDDLSTILLALPTEPTDCSAHFGELVRYDEGGQTQVIGDVGGSLTPEPATLSLLALGGLVVLRRRCR
jgi:hypothetical protein